MMRMPKFSNLTVPKPAGPVMGPGRLKMPETAMDEMPHSTSLAHLPGKVKPLPATPLQLPKMGTTQSLFHTDSRGPSGLNGIGR